MTTQYADPHSGDDLAELKFPVRVALALETVKAGMEARGTLTLTVPDIAAAASEWTTSNVSMFGDDEDDDQDGGPSDYYALLNTLGHILSDSMEGS